MLEADQRLDACHLEFIFFRGILLKMESVKLDSAGDHVITTVNDEPDDETSSNDSYSDCNEAFSNSYCDEIGKTNESWD